ncbi:uncharacterized protein LOC116350392 [Contarinia nasturtii]|uniref:uncharacterized protein LOC116350392 n=1 Tax=Contarinia nasturtii TaxID=265458 RepID=UPI0012D3D35A|nr:uncharacterized protein LOC116350392 [Contarinia nasturtii]
MLSKVIFLTVLIAAACSAEEAKAERYPANVDPELCPDYPNCNNDLLHPTAKVSVFEEAKPDRYPANVDPDACPGYPNCDNALLHGTEQIAVLPTVHKTWVPGNRYYTVNDVTHVADEYIPASRYVIPSYTAPIVRYASPYISAVPVAKYATLPGFSPKLFFANY